MSNCKGVFCFEILADADPVVLIRLVERMQSLQLAPQHLDARWTEDRVKIHFECSGLNEAGARILARRIEQFTTVHCACCADQKAASTTPYVSNLIECEIETARRA